MANSLDYLRQALGPEFASYNDEALIRLAADSTGADPLQIAQAYGVGADRGKTGSRFSSAIDSYQANMYGLGEAATGADWFRRGREENELAATIANRRARELGAVERWDQVHGLGDFGDYAAGAAIQSLPYLAEAAVGGLAARGLSTGLRAAGSAAREMGMPAAEKQIAEQMARRAALGGAVASYPSAVGDILSNQREQLSAQGLDAGGVDLTSAAIGGVPYAALNYFSPAERIAAGGSVPHIASYLDNAKGITGGLKRMGANAAILGAGEGLNETGQEFANQYFGRMAVDPNATMTSGDALDRYKESFIGGATLGGLMGGGVGGWKRSDKWYEDQAKQLRAAQNASRLEQGAAVDLMAPPGELDLQGGEVAPAYSPLFDNGAGVFGGPVMATTQMRDAGIDTQAAAERRNELLREKQEALHNLDLIEQQYGKSDIFYTALQGSYPRIDAIDKEVEQIDRHLARYGDQGVQGQQASLDFSSPGVLDDPSTQGRIQELGLRLAQPTQVTPDLINQNTGVGAQRYAGPNYGSDFEALANSPSGQMVSEGPKQWEEGVPALDRIQRLAGLQTDGQINAAAKTAGEQAGAQFRERVSKLGLNPDEGKHQQFVKKLDEAIAKGAVTEADAHQFAGMVVSGVAPGTVLDHNVKPKVAEADKVAKKAAALKDKQGANLRTAIAEHQHGLLDAEGVSIVQAAISQGHDGSTALTAARKAFNERKKAAAKEAEDARRKAAGEAAMKETTPATDKLSTKPAPIVVPAQPAANVGEGAGATQPKQTTTTEEAPKAPRVHTVAASTPPALRTATGASEKPGLGTEQGIQSVHDKIAALKAKMGTSSVNTKGPGGKQRGSTTGYGLFEHAELLAAYVELAAHYIARFGRNAIQVLKALKKDGLTEDQANYVYAQARKERRVEIQRDNPAGTKSSADSRPLVHITNDKDGNPVRIVARMDRPKASKELTTNAVVELKGGRWIINPELSGLAKAKDAEDINFDLGGTVDEALDNLPHTVADMLAVHNPRAYTSMFPKEAVKSVVGKDGVVQLPLVHDALKDKPDMLRAVRYALGVDDDGTTFDSHPSVEIAAKKAGVNRATLQNRLTALGITSAQIDKFARIGTPTDLDGNFYTARGSDSVDERMGSDLETQVDAVTSSEDARTKFLSDEYSEDHKHEKDDSYRDVKAKAANLRTVDSAGASKGDVAATKKTNALITSPVLAGSEQLGWPKLTTVIDGETVLDKEKLQSVPLANLLVAMEELSGHVHVTSDLNPEEASDAVIRNAIANTTAFSQLDSAIRSRAATGDSYTGYTALQAKRDKQVADAKKKQATKGSYEQNDSENVDGIGEEDGSSEQGETTDSLGEDGRPERGGANASNTTSKRPNASKSTGSSVQGADEGGAAGQVAQFSKAEQSPEAKKLRSDINRYEQLLACLTR